MQALTRENRDSLNNVLGFNMTTQDLKSVRECANKYGLRLGTFIRRILLTFMEEEKNSCKEVCIDGIIC